MYNRFYKFREDTGPYKKGDNVVFSTAHNDMVLIATPTRETQYYTIHKSTLTLNYSQKMDLEKFIKSKLEPLNKHELLKIFPHLTKRIKVYDAYWELAQHLPEYICERCLATLNLEIRDGWKDHFKIDKCCHNCKSGEKTKVYFRNSLKPINL